MAQVFMIKIGHDYLARHKDNCWYCTPTPKLARKFSTMGDLKQYIQDRGGVADSCVTEAISPTEIEAMEAAAHAAFMAERKGAK